MASAERSSNIFEAGWDSISPHSTCSLRQFWRASRVEYHSIESLPSAYFVFLCFVSIPLPWIRKLSSKCLNKGPILQNLLYRAGWLLSFSHSKAKILLLFIAFMLQVNRGFVAWEYQDLIERVCGGEGGTKGKNKIKYYDKDEKRIIGSDVSSNNQKYFSTTLTRVPCTSRELYI